MQYDIAEYMRPLPSSAIVPSHVSRKKFLCLEMCPIRLHLRQGNGEQGVEGVQWHRQDLVRGGARNKTKRK